MPTVSVGRDRLFDALGQTYGEHSKPSIICELPLFLPSCLFVFLLVNDNECYPLNLHLIISSEDKEFEDLCFKFGIELDDIVSLSVRNAPVLSLSFRIP